MSEQKKVLIAGERTWTDRETIRKVLETLPPKTIIVHGACASGADRIADEEARKMTSKDFEIRPYPADWEGFEARGNRNSAGPARNSEMLRKEHPDKAGIPIHQGFAFATDIKRARGTSDITTKARAKGIKVEVISG